MICKSEICKFNFLIGWDKHCYYVNLKINSGHHIHNSHAKSNAPATLRLFDEDNKETFYHIFESACNKTAGQNYLLS